MVTARSEFVAPNHGCEASAVHAFQGRTVDTVIAAMEANHPHLTNLRTLCVEISRARDRILGEIGALRSCPGDARGALTASRAIAARDRRRSSLAFVARAQGVAGDAAGTARSIALAIEAAGTIADNCGRAVPLARIAGIQIDAMESRAGPEEDQVPERPA